MYSVQTFTYGVTKDLVSKCRQNLLTLTLLLVIWAVEIFARFVTDSKIDFNEMMGIQFSKPWTYISYAFAHRDMEHIAGNSILLILGIPIESSYGRKTFLITVGAAIVFGALGALGFYLLSGELNDEPIVGASTIGSAFVIAGINATIQAGALENRISGCMYWIRKSIIWFLAMSILCGLYLFAKGMDVGAVLVVGMLLGLTFTVLVLCLKAVLQWRKVQATKSWLPPIILFAILLYAELTGSSEWFYGNSGHLGGMLVGLIASFWTNWRKPIRYRADKTTVTSI